MSPRQLQSSAYAIVATERKTLNDFALKEKYSNVITSYLSQGHCQHVKPEESACEGWYLSHHAVLHPHKPEKVRVVFDCAAKYAGFS